MSMTKEEAIKWLEETIQDTDTYWKSCSEALQKELDEQKEVFNLALTALRPITREQVKKMRGEWTTDGVCSRCGFDAMYYKGVPVQVRTNYCPACGSPLTDEAVETIMKRMEEMRND